MFYPRKNTDRQREEVTKGVSCESRFLLLSELHLGHRARDRGKLCMAAAYAVRLRLPEERELRAVASQERFHTTAYHEFAKHACAIIRVLPPRLRRRDVLLKRSRCAGFQFHTLHILAAAYTSSVQKWGIDQLYLLWLALGLVA